MTEHIHAEILRAIADGKEVEWREGCVWIESDREVNPLSFPLYTWRIKPEKQVLNYRVALMNDGDFYSATADTKEDAKDLKNSEYFVKWVCDWQKVEVEL
jgi:hypothetical protein